MTGSKKGGLTLTREKILEMLCNHSEGLNLMQLPGDKNDASALVRSDHVELLNGKYFITPKGRHYVDNVVRS